VVSQPTEMWIEIARQQGSFDGRNSRLTSSFAIAPTYNSYAEAFTANGHWITSESHPVPGSFRAAQQTFSGAPNSESR
jgi:hypothetical protein